MQLESKRHHPKSQNLWGVIFLLLLIALTFNPNSANAEITFLTPTETIDYNGEVYFSWDATIPASSYIVYLGKVNLGGSVTIIMEKLIPKGHQSVSIDIREEGYYKWQVLALNDSGGVMEVSIEGDFSIILAQPPEQLEPASGASFAEGEEISRE